MSGALLHALVLGALPGLAVMGLLRAVSLRPRVRHTVVLMGLAGPWFALGGRIAPTPDITLEVPSSWLESATLVSSATSAGAEPTPPALPSPGPDAVPAPAAGGSHVAWSPIGILLAACDAAVIEQGVRPSTYARAILDLIAEHRPATAGASFTSGGGSRLRSRLERVLRPGVRHERSSRGYAASIGVVLTATTLIVPSLPSGLPAPDSPLVTGCRWVGGAHLVREAWGARTVAWEGPGCRVDYRARSDVWTRFTEGGARSLLPGDSMALTVARDGAVERRVLRAGRSGVVVTSSGGGRTRATGTAAATWSERLRNELDLHTAVLAPERVPDLLAAGGVDRLLSFVRETQGDFAGTAYLDHLVRTGPLGHGELRDVLRVAGDVGDNDAVLAALLVSVLERYDIEAHDPDLTRALSRIDAAAARAEVLRAGRPE